MTYQINKVAVLGSGVMGSGIAAHLVGAGLDVCLLDIVPNSLTPEEERKGFTLDDQVVRNRIAQNGKDRILDKKAKMKQIFHDDFGKRICTGNFDDHMHYLEECDWIIEVIVERLDIKQKLMERIALHRKPNAIVSSNTSGVSINGIVEGMSDEFKAHFLGTHFFNPPRYMMLFELIPASHTKPEIVDFIVKFAEKRLGKGVVIAKDTPNFIANRIGTYSSVVAINLMEEYGLNFEEVDALTGQILGRPKSATFKTLDMVGIDVLVHVVNNLNATLEDPKEIEKFKLSEIVTDMVENNRLGNKTKGGFYKRVSDAGGKRTLVWDIETNSYVPTKRVSIPAYDKASKRGSTKKKIKSLISKDTHDSKFTWNIIKSLLLYSAARVPEITEDFRNIDLAMKWGYNWEIGPFELWDLIGVQESADRMVAEGEQIPSWVVERLADGQTNFYNSEEQSGLRYPVIKENIGAQLLNLGDDVLGLRFKSVQNTVTKDVIDMIDYAVDVVEKGYKGLVLANTGKNFSVGANLLQIAMLGAVRDYDSIGEIVTQLQNANMKLKYCKRPVVSAPFGMTLGGGMEVVLHTHAATAHSETYMGLVEAGVGLVPAGGGTKELLFRNIPQGEKLSAAQIFEKTQKVFQNIATAVVASSGFDASKRGFLPIENRIIMNKYDLIDEAKNEVLRLADEGFQPKISGMVPVAGSTGLAAFRSYLYNIREGGMISHHDEKVAGEIAWVLCGGDVPVGTLMTETEILELEKQAFLKLLHEPKTHARIHYLLKTNKPLRN